MPKLDYSIYGYDDNDFAQKVASESLNGLPNDGAEDYWMGCSDLKDGSDDVGKGNVGEESAGPLGDVPKLKGFAAGNHADKEKFRMPPQWTSDNRHKPGPTKSTAHDYESKHVPSNHTQTTNTDKSQTTLFRGKK